MIAFVISLGSAIADEQKANSIGVKIEGSCVENSTCPPAVLETGSRDRFRFSVTKTLNNGDVYRIFGAIEAFNPDGTNVQFREPFSIAYEGHIDKGSLVCEPVPRTSEDEVDVEISQSWRSNVSYVNEVLGTKAIFFPTTGDSGGRTAQEILYINGNEVANFGPLQSPMPTGQLLKRLSARLDDNGKEEDLYVSKFGPGSQVGSMISYHMDSAPFYASTCVKP